MGKVLKPLLEKVEDVDWRGRGRSLMARIRPYALQLGRAGAWPLFQCYYVLCADKTTTLDRGLIYAAVVYIISPVGLLPSAVYGFLGILDEGGAALLVYKKIKDKITPEINAQVNANLNEWFGVEYEIV